jgi:acyl-CoA synthetase (AMP-forming)/AMP-acid ligase II
MLNAEAQIFTPYGATESLPVCSIGSREILAETREYTDRGKGVCVGHAVPDIELKIIQISDAAIECWDDSLTVAEGDIGEIIVKGPQVTGSYYNRPKSTALAKIDDRHNGGFFHRMGDLGYRDRKGRVWFCGRKAHRVICPDRTLYTIPCEAIFNTHPKVFRSALVGVGQADNRLPVICVELEQGVRKSEQPQLQAELLKIAQGHDLTRTIGHILFHPAFPVDIRHNAKIFREKLAVWAQGQLS